VVGFALALLAALGTAWHVAGHRVVPLPWAALVDAPLFDNVLPVRFALYASLAAAVIVASWAARARRGPALALTGLAVLALAPDLGAGHWKRTPIRPAFFAEGLYRTCLGGSESLLTVPWNHHGDSLLWQAESGFRFALAGGYVRPGVPREYSDDPILPFLHDVVPSADNRVEPYEWAQSRGVTTILIQDHGEQGWSAFLTDSAHPAQRVDGVTLFPVMHGRVTSEACRSGGG
jgi:hypothetical protein